jgi:MFS family permease
METLHDTLAPQQNPHWEGSGFLKIWFPSFLVFFANTLGLFGIKWWLALTPGGSGILGITVGIADIVAIVVVVLFAGSIDRNDKPTILNSIKGAMMLGLVLLVPIFLISSVNIGFVITIIASFLIMDCTSELYSASMETILADLAPERWPSSRTAALIQIVSRAASLLAPLAGGGLIAIGWLWSLPLLGIVSICTAFGLLILWSQIIRTQQVAKISSNEKVPEQWLQRLFSDSHSAIQWIKNQPTLIFMLVISVTLNFIVFPFYTLFPAFLQELQVSNAVIIYGYGSAIYGGGLLLVTVIFMFFPYRPNKPISFVTILVCCIVLDLGLITLFPTPPLLIGAMGILGCLFMIVIVVVGGIWLDQTPAAVRVRVFSLRRLVGYTSLPLGASLMGIAGATIGFVLILRVLLSVVVLIVALTLGILFLQKQSMKHSQQEKER